MSVSALQPPSQKQWFVLVAVLLAALVLRLALWGAHAGVSVEGAQTLLTARTLGSGLPWDGPQSVGYALLIRILSGLGAPPLAAARMLDLLAGLAAVALTWVVARRWIATWWLAVLPALAVALMPLPVRYSLGTQPDMLYLALILGAVAGAQGGRWWVAGMLLGLAAQLRPEALVVLAAFLWVSWGKGGRVPLLGWAVAMFALVWMFQGVLLQNWIPFPQPVEHAYTHWLDRTTLEAPQYPAFLGRVGALVANTLSFGGWWVPVLALAAVSGSAPLATAALVPVVVSPWLQLGGHPRFVLAWLPFLWILAFLVVERLGKPVLKGGAAAVCVAGLFLSAALHSPEAYTLKEDGAYPELRAAGEWLKSFTRPDMVVTGSMPQVAFYSGARYRPLPEPTGDYFQTVDAIVESGADFAVFHEQCLAKSDSTLLPLVNDKSVTWHESRLEPVYFDDSYMDGRTLVYRVVRPGGLAPLPTEGPDMRRLLSKLPHGRDHVFHAQVCMRAKKYDTAASEYYLAAQTHPGTPEAAYDLNNRAWCLLKNGDYDKARSEANRALDILPHQEEFIDTMIEIVRALGQDRAVEYWEGKLKAAKEANAAKSQESP